ncbi:MAG: hypothetical protein HUU20_17140 [Pirellulales bacterium]|nr:hypothetical protein [Pirellulales bacterium]
MNQFHQFVSTVLSGNGITPAEVHRIRDELYRDGRLNLDDVKLLVELYCQARSHCPAFEDLFFDVLEQVILADGEIQPSEEFYLLKMLYSDREVRPREKQFLADLAAKATHTTPAFEALCREAFHASATGWSVGGK